MLSKRQFSLLVRKVARLEEEGDFKKASSLLKSFLENAPNLLSAQQKTEVGFELERLRRIRLDYSLTKEALYSDLRKSIKDITPEEFSLWIKKGRFDERLIDGKRCFLGMSKGNLFFRYPELEKRRISDKAIKSSLEGSYYSIASIQIDRPEVQNTVLRNCILLKNAACSTKIPYVLPKKLKVIMAVKVNPDVAPHGETIRAWLPIPRDYPHQKEFKLLSSSPKVKNIDGEASTIRSAYFEDVAKKGCPTEFKITYSYKTFGMYFDVNPEKIVPYNRSDLIVRQYTSEGPHIVFSKELKKLSRRISRNEKNPLIKARKFYNWITDNIKYSYAPEYSTIRNLGDYCLKNGYGDCGMEALLFITLCRQNSIPARWQSGWLIFPGWKTIHDWAEIYVPPYGWVPVDCYVGIFAMQYMTSLTQKQREDVRDFYFGGLDQYRIAANSDHCQELRPPKRSFRSDNVDFQRGELEFGDNNIYFNEYLYSLDVIE